MGALSFAIGERVRLVKDKRPRNASGHDPQQPEDGIIDTVCIDTGYLQYGFNGVSWFNHDQFEWIGEPTMESLEQALNTKSYEDEEEEEWCDTCGGVVGDDCSCDEDVG